MKFVVALLVGSDFDLLCVLYDLCDLKGYSTLREGICGE